jgi:hypothetical protein
MNKNIIFGILKYLDYFGTTFNFYIDRNRKLYTPLGGLLTILSIFFAVLIFTYINLDDFLQNVPNSTTSIKSHIPRNIKFKEEKIWIPWRIRDFGGKTVNHKNLFYPIIYYYKGIWSDELKSMNISYELLDYKLCSETSMVNNTDFYMIDIELDQLYCIDMEDLDIGGNWNYEFLNMISLDIYACKDGIDYDGNNSNCIKYETYIEKAGNDSCYDFEVYYPIVHYQPINKTNPFFIKYNSNFYHFSRYSNKIDRIYLQQYILNDDSGWILKNEKIFSSWGCTSLTGDSYATGDKRDLMNKGSTSRFYSFNIYLESDILYFNRNYKKIQLIIADGLPIVNIVIIVFRIFAKIFKISSGNKKLTELLFENLKEKKTFMKINQKQLVDKKISLLKNHSQMSHGKNIIINRNNNDLSAVQLTHIDSGKKIKYENLNIIGNNNIINNINNNNKHKYFRSINTHQITNKKYSKKIIKRSFNSFKDSKNISNNDNTLMNNKSIDVSSNFPLNTVQNEYYLHNNKTTNNIMPTNKILQSNSLIPSKNVTSSNIKSKTHYIKKKLFPYKYYLCSIFIKNIDISKESFFFTKKFIIVYNFICQLFDMSSYLVLQREFQIMKNTVIEEKQRNIIEREQKINVNESTFNVNMNECLNTKKLSIFGRINQPKNIKK